MPRKHTKVTFFAEGHRVKFLKPSKGASSPTKEPEQPLLKKSPENLNKENLIKESFNEQPATEEEKDCLGMHWENFDELDMADLKRLREYVQREVKASYKDHLWLVYNFLPSDCQKAKDIIKREIEGRIDWSD